MLTNDYHISPVVRTRHTNVFDKNRRLFDVCTPLEVRLIKEDLLQD